MCLDFAARVVAVADGMAVVESDGRRRRAQTLLEPETKVGDWVRVALGSVIERLPADAAREINRELAHARGAG